VIGIGRYPLGVSFASVEQVPENPSAKVIASEAKQSLSVLGLLRHKERSSQ
jgi:hypothetical protein